MQYTVLLLLPDFVAETFGHDTYLVHVTADDVPAAIETAQDVAYEAHPASVSGELFPLFVCEGHQHDIKDDEPVTINLLLTEAECRAMARVLMRFNDDTGSNIDANTATNILGKLRMAIASTPS